MKPAQEKALAAMHTLARIGVRDPSTREVLEVVRAGDRVYGHSNVLAALGKLQARREIREVTGGDGPRRWQLS